MYPGSLHNHTDYSNFRLRDAISTVEGLMDYALELGHEVIAFTEHETVSNSVNIIEAYEARKKDNPNFKVILGNEIYLTRNGLNAENFDATKDKYFHFILLAKDKEGHKQIRELSTRAWMRSYMARGMRRVPTYYQDLEEIIKPNQGHVIFSTACLGGQLPQLILKYKQNKTKENFNNIVKWCKYIEDIAGKGNFYLELQPSYNEEQIIVNKTMIDISKFLDIPYIITTDSHYINKEERFIHEVYLKSQSGDREVAEFYNSTYLMGTEELEEYLSYLSKEQLDEAYKNIRDIKNQCEDYDLRKNLRIPELPWKDTYITDKEVNKYLSKIPNLKYFVNSSFEGDKLLAKMIIQGIQEKKDELDNQDTYDEIDIELDSVWQSSLVNKAHWSSYFLNLQKIIDTVWEAGSLVGPGRGSGVGFLILYILGITQINPLKETTKTYPWRFLNPARVSVLDVDFDISGLKRSQVLDKFREVYGETRVANVLTLGTEKSKSAILTAARGLGIDNDIAQYIASLVPSDRGLIRSLNQCYYGDEENDMKPVAPFVQEMKQYPNLWEVASRIEGIICRTGIHAGGVIFVDEPFTEAGALMRAPDGTIITQFELHTCEKISFIKYDALSVEAEDKIQNCLELLLKYGYLEDKGSLKANYESAIGVYNLERNAPDMWKMVWEHKIQSLFQMEKDSGIQGIALTKPKSVDDLATLNSVIRLMAQEKGAEQPLQKYARYKNDPSLWYKEMELYGLTKEEQKILEPILATSYGICESQEKFMTLVQIPECGGFDLNWADRLRKSIAKKNPKDYQLLEKEYFERVEEKGLSKNLCEYVWHVLIATSRGYGFNQSHTLAYSLVGLQEMNLAYRFPIIFWNCANLIVDSGAIEGLEDKTANYGKIAIAVNKIKAQTDTSVSLIDINKSELSFTPDAENNKIYFGMAGLQGVGNEVCQQIIENRPYNSFEDFRQKTKVNKTVTIALIKSGAFDQFGQRKDIMEQYLREVSEPKKRLTMQNFNGLIEKNLIPQELNFQKRLFVFNKALRKNKYKDYFILKADNFYKFYNTFFDVDKLVPVENKLGIDQKLWKKMYDEKMKPAKEYISKNQKQMLTNFNNQLFQEQWDKYALGSYSTWEMESLGTYEHEHELSKIPYDLYGISSYSELSDIPQVDYTFKKNGIEIPIFKTTRIIGTIIAKDELHSSATILTPEKDVVTIKMGKDYFARYNKRISEIMPDGTKKMRENGFFQRGTLVMVNGYRRGKTFVLKAYKRTNSHQLYKITNVYKDGSLDMTNKRYGEEEEAI